ncbi:MAG: hypothetical protein WB567_14505 [Terracidiphilus sp.]
MTRPTFSARMLCFLRGPALVAMLIGCAAVVTAQQASQPAQSSSPTATGSTVPLIQAEVSDQPGGSGKKLIADQAEYNAFIAATKTEDPKERAEAFESFAQKYPKSVVATDALEEAMAAWQTVGDSVKVLEVAKEILTSDQGNVRALAIVVALDRVSAAQGDSAALDELCLDSTGGMRVISMWKKPTDMPDADFAKLRKQMDIIFNGAAGYCALQQRDFSQARDWYSRVLQADPTDLQDTYQLAIADLEMTPIDANGFWYCAHAIYLAQNSSNAGAAGGMESYCKPKYVAYHGNDQGWDSVMTMGATRSNLPGEFAAAISPGPTPPAPPAAPQD